METPKDTLAELHGRLLNARGRLMLDMYTKEGLTTSQIGKRFGISRQRVHQIIGQQRAAAHYGRARKEERRRKVTEAYERVLNGSTIKEEADRLQITKGTLYQNFSAMGLELPKKESPEHGTPYRYRNGCRCWKCRSANREYKERYYQREPPVHGTVSSYRNYACRCRECRKAANKADREYRKRKRKENYDAS